MAKIAKKKVTKKKVVKKKVVKKKVVKKKVTEEKEISGRLSVNDKVSLGKFVENDGNVLLVAKDSDDEAMDDKTKEFVQITSYMYRKLIKDIEAVRENFDIGGFELKGILKIF